MAGCAPDSLFSKYTQRVTITKRMRMLNIPLYKTATGQRSFYFRTAKLWNSLDSTPKLKPTKGLQTLPEEKSSLKHFRNLIALPLLLLSFYFILLILITYYN